MDTINNKETTLLGLLAEGEMHPYQIEKEIEQRDMRFWTEISMSSIYKLLRKLEERELVESTVQVGEGNRAQKRYAITDAGRSALRNQVKILASEPEHLRWRVDLAITNLDILSYPEARGSLEAYEAALTEKIEGYERLEKYLIDEGCPGFRLALARRPQYLYRAEREWVREYLDSLDPNEFVEE